MCIYIVVTWGLHKYYILKGGYEWAVMNEHLTVTFQCYQTVMYMCYHNLIILTLWYMVVLAQLMKNAFFHYLLQNNALDLLAANNYVYMYLYVHVYKCIYMYIHVHVCIHVHIYMYMYIHV